MKLLTLVFLSIFIYQAYCGGRESNDAVKMELTHDAMHHNHGKEHEKTVKGVIQKSHAVNTHGTSGTPVIPPSSQSDSTGWSIWGGISKYFAGLSAQNNGDVCIDQGEPHPRLSHLIHRTKHDSHDHDTGPSPDISSRNTELHDKSTMQRENGMLRQLLAYMRKPAHAHNRDFGSIYRRPEWPLGPP